VHFEPETAAILRKAEDVVVRRADKEVLDEIFIFEPRPTGPPGHHGAASGRMDTLVRFT